MRCAARCRCVAATLPLSRAASTHASSSSSHNSSSSSTTTATATATATRRRLWERLVPNFDGQKQPLTRTTADILHNPLRGHGYDPVTNNERVRRGTAVLEHTRMSDASDYLDVDEVSKWLDARHAAEVLGIAASELPLLTRETVEARWHAVYRTRANAKREEVMIAAEVLLEYVDSTAQMKKSRRYYREQLQAARLAIDAERHAHRREYVYTSFQLTAAGMMVSTVVILLVAVLQRRREREECARGGDDDGGGGRSKADWLTASLRTVVAQGTGVASTHTASPPPDYSTRYFATPSALEQAQREHRRPQDDTNNSSSSSSDAQDVTAALLLADAHTAALVRDAAAYDDREAADTLQLWNDEKARATREAAAAAQRASRVAVHYQPPPREGDGSSSSSSSTTTTTTEAAVVPGARAEAALHNLTMAQRYNILHNTVGGRPLLGEYFRSRKSTKDTRSDAADDAGDGGAGDDNVGKQARQV